MTDLNDSSSRQKDIKKSKFVSATTVSDTDYFDFVSNNQNFRILKSDLVTLFGTTGSLEQLGDPTGAPVLNKSGTINRIRNIEAGAGITPSLSALNGIQLDHNFTVDTTGVAIMKNPTSESPTIRSIQAGTGISVAAQNGYIQIALSATPVSNKTVIVNEIADFPTAVGGVITLEADTFYFVTNDLSTANRFVLQSDTVLAGSDGTLITLLYTGTGVMFTSVDNSNKIKEIIVSCPSGTLLDISCTTCTNLFQMVNTRVLECDEIGTIDNMGAINIQNILWGEIITDGLKLSGHNSIVSFFQNIGTLSAGTFLDLQTSTFDGLSFSNSQGTLAAGAVFLAGAVDSGNVASGGFAVVINTRAAGLGTALSGISVTDSLWEFFANNGIADSRNSLLASNAGTTVTIAATDTPVILGATWVDEEASRFTATAGGRFTYTGKGAFVTYHATITATVSTGVNIDCTFYFFKNGVEITSSGVQRSFSSSATGNFSMLWSDDLATGDYIEVFAENNSTTADVVVSQAIVRFD